MRLRYVENVHPIKTRIHKVLGKSGNLNIHNSQDNLQTEDLYDVTESSRSAINSETVLSTGDTFC